MSKSLGNVVSLRDVLDAWGRETVLLFFLSAHWRKPIDFTDETLAQAKAQVETLPQRLPRSASRRRRGGVGGVSSARARRRLQHAGGARAAARLARASELELLRAGSGSSGSARSPSSGRRRPELVELAEQRQRGARARTRLRRGGPAPRRDRRSRLGRPRHAARRATGSSRARDPRAGLRAAAGPGGAARPARGARAVGDGAGAQPRALASRGRQPRVQVKLDRDLTEAAGTRDHQGVLAWCEPYRYADAYELAARRAPAARLPRPGQRPAQPRRRLPQRRGRRRDRASSFPRTAPPG